MHFQPPPAHPWEILSVHTVHQTFYVGHLTLPYSVQRVGTRINQVYLLSQNEISFEALRFSPLEKMGLSVGSPRTSHCSSLPPNRRAEGSDHSQGLHPKSAGPSRPDVPQAVYLCGGCACEAPVCSVAPIVAVKRGPKHVFSYAIKRQTVPSGRGRRSSEESDGIVEFDGTEVPETTEAAEDDSEDLAHPVGELRGCMWGTRSGWELFCERIVLGRLML